MKQARGMALISALVLVASMAAGQQQKYLFNKLVAGTAGKPLALASGDFNNDGKLDIVTANSGSNSVSILLGKADATFNAKADSAAGNQPSSVAVGDFNGDGNLDLAVTNGRDNTVSILLGTGKGNFLTHVDYAVGSNPQSVAVADFNADGKLDLVVANAAGKSASVLLGNGDGSFAPHVDYGTGSQPQWVTVADLNGDHKLDLAVACSFDGVVTVLLGDGKGGFGAAINAQTAKRPVSVAAGDLNGDGILDLVTADNYGTNQISMVSVLIGNGDGTFKPSVEYTTASLPGQIALSDLNGDGKLDVVLSAQQGIAQNFLLPGAVSVLLGNGDGTLHPQISYASGTGSSGLIVADMNHDGRLDLVTSNSGDNTISVLLGQGDGKFIVSAPVFNNPSQGTNFSQGLVSGDFNHDGALDMATVDSVKSLDVFLGTNMGSFLPAMAYPVGTTPVDAAKGDFNGDGNLDLAVLSDNSNTTGPVQIFLGNGDGTFTMGSTYPTGQVPLGILAADFNQDGILDLAISNFDSFNIAIMFGNGDGTFQAAKTYSFGGIQPVSFAVGDFNSDGYPDLAITNNDIGKYVSIMLNDGHGGLKPAYTVPTVYYSFTVGVGDIRGIGRQDIATGANFPAPISVLLSNGDGTFQPAVGYNVGSLAGTSAISFGDMDGDGNQDMVVAQADYLSVLRGRGDGTFYNHVDYFVPRASITGLALGDFSGYGALDMATPGSYAVGVLRNNSVIALFPGSVNYGTQTVGKSVSQTVQVNNPGVAKLTPASLLITGVNAADFSQTDNCPAIIPSGKKCTVTVTFTPQATGARQANLVITTSGLNATYKVALAGTGK